MYLMEVLASTYVVLQPKKSFTIKLLKYMYQQSKKHCTVHCIWNRKCHHFQTQGPGKIIFPMKNWVYVNCRDFPYESMGLVHPLLRVASICNKVQ